MTIAIEYLSDLNLVRATYFQDVTTQDLTDLVERFEAEDHPKSASVLHDFSRAERVTFTTQDIVDQALRRSATVPENPVHPVCAAFFGLNEETKVIVEMWLAFFKDDPRFFSCLAQTELEALDWLASCQADPGECTSC